MITKIENVYVFNTEKRAFTYGSLTFADGKIVEDYLAPDTVIDGKDGYVIPGLIDVHTHGRCGLDIMELSAEELTDLSRAYAVSGVTTVLPTVMTSPYDKLKKAISEIMKADMVADFAGVHIEGPYISANKPGCHNIPDIRKPSKKEFDELISMIAPRHVHFTIAPEEDEEKTIPYLHEKYGTLCTVGIGHTGCDYETCMQALKDGARSFTHTFNAMTGLSHRQPGVVGAALSTSAYAEFIVDGVHVAPSVISLAYHAKEMQNDKFVLITDSIPPAGLPNGNYEMNGIAFTLQDGKATTPSGTIVGSALDLFTAVKNLKKFAGISFEEALICATKNPAEMVGLYGDRGSLTVGKRADMLLLNKDLAITDVYVAGKHVDKK